MANSLTLSGIEAGYGAVRILHGVSLTVGGGETVALLGTNGNGKSTLMKCVMGMVRPSAGSIVAEIDGQRHELVGKATEAIVDLGIGFVPEGRRLFPRLSVTENLLLGAFRPAARAAIKENLAFCLETFPRLAERRGQLAGSMSGGEQQMLALGRAMMSEPTLLCLDEPSLGLAPRIVQDIFRTIREINRAGTSVLLVEQNARYALDTASRGYVLQTGRIIASGTCAELREDVRVREAYLGRGAALPSPAGGGSA